MATAVERLTGLVDSPDRHDIPLADLLPVQMEAANERLSAQRQTVRLLANRVESSNSRTSVGEPADEETLKLLPAMPPAPPASPNRSGRRSRPPP